MIKITTFLVIYLIVNGFCTDVEDFGNPQFASALYNELPENENILISPFSLEIILALIESGAKGQTASELSTTLHISNKTTQNSLIASILDSIKSDEYILQTANKVYVKHDFPITESFKKTATDFYKADFENVNFAQNVATSEEINQWIENQTNDKIHDVITPDDLDASTVFVLVNTLYFDGNWSLPFETNRIQTAKFFLTSSDDTDVEYLFNPSESFNYAESEELNAQILELPFKDNQASMVIVLPQETDGVRNLRSKINLVATPQFSKTYVQVSLPKFKIESSIDFIEILETLGITRAFTPLEADLSGIAGNPGDIYIDKVFQKTFIDVKEVGVTAGAATVAGGTLAAVPPPAAKYFKADHPFLFYIQANGVILFEGTVFNPSR